MHIILHIEYNGGLSGHRGGGVPFLGIASLFMHKLTGLIFWALEVFWGVFQIVILVAFFNP